MNIIELGIYEGEFFKLVEINIFALLAFFMIVLHQEYENK